MQKFVRIERVGQVFQTRKGPFVALRDIDLTVAQGEFITLIGHSGCGKSTLLNLVAGLSRPTSGVLLCAEKEIVGPGPERAVVFQNHSLLPWMSCFQNVYLGVERVFGQQESKARMVERTHAALELVGLTHARSKLPREISGGMKQRVGIARALAMEPKVLLMDEPFGALDALTRAHLQDELLKIVSKTRTTTIMVTHDVDEAVLLSDRIVMLTNGPAATIGQVLPVPLARPRDRVELANDPAYLACRAAVVDFLHRRYGNPALEKTTAEPDTATAAVAADPVHAVHPAQPIGEPHVPDAPAIEASGGAHSPVAGGWLAGSDKPEKQTVRVGFIPLVDCATVAMAAELGFDKRYGLRIETRKQASWAMVRDGLGDGTLDASHALYSMVYGTHLGIGGDATPMAILMALSQNGQGIVLARSIAERGIRDGWALARAVRAGESLTLAHTFATGTHAMWLAYWLAAHGIDPTRDVDRVVVPPPRTVAALQDGLVHGFCVGEPWHTLAIETGAGFNVASTQSMWPGHPEKVLATTAQWADAHPNTARALIAALLDTARYVDDPANRETVARRLAQPDLIGQPADLIAGCLAGQGRDGLGRQWQDKDGLTFFDAGRATYPYQSDGMWFLTQFVRWGLLREAPDYRALATEVQRTALYAEAAAAAGVPVPASTDRDVRLFDGRHWRARDAASYAGSFPIAARRDATQAADAGA
jgi:nitrate/nitrite transport system ATP-binding protein